MKKIFFSIFICFAVVTALPVTAQSVTEQSTTERSDPALELDSAGIPNPTTIAVEPTKTEFFKARITNLLKPIPSEDQDNPSYSSYVQMVQVVFLTGPEKGQNRDVPYYPKSASVEQQLSIGDTVFVSKVSDGPAIYYSVSERYRFNILLWATLLFLVLVIITGRLKGLGSIAGLVFSLFIIVKFIIPAILAGHNPLLVCLGGAIAIALVSLYIAHGFNLRTSLAVISTIFIIGITTGLDWFLIHAAKLFGAGTEEAVYAQFGSAGTINLRGLLLGGIIVGVLGVLDDITTAQAAVVDELHQANPSFGFSELYRRGTSVGREHIASLINTLVLAYVGASFPLVLLFQHYEQPLIYILNSELVAEEIARTLIGSTALILAVPLTTALSAYVLSKRPVRTGVSRPHHGHSH
jgi:uncharacterized membrane protein